MFLRTKFVCGIGAATVCGVLSVPTATGAPAPTPVTATSAHVSVYATGLLAPRGLTFGPRGDLYVAEAGSGGTTTTVNICPDIQFSAAAGGPGMNGPTARISRVTKSGTRSTVVDGLPSVVTSFGGDWIGVADVAFVHNTLYGLVAGGGCANGNPDPKRPNGVIRVDRDGSWRYVANLSSYYAKHPSAVHDEEDFVVDGVPYDMVAKAHSVDIVEANSGVIDRVSLRTGSIRRIVDISRTKGHNVPTSIARDRGKLYVADLGSFTVKTGSQSVYLVGRGGTLQEVAHGLTAVSGIAFDRHHRLYALEITDADGAFVEPGHGQIRRLRHNGTWETVVRGLNFPTAMIFGRDGALYVSVNGYNVPGASGQVLRIGLEDHGQHHTR